MSFNGRFLNDPMIHKPYRNTRSNGLDFICFIVPKAETLTRLQILWMTFTVEVWLCVAVTFALMIKSFQLFNKLNLSGGRKISDPFMTSLQVEKNKFNNAVTITQHHYADFRNSCCRSFWAWAFVVYRNMWPGVYFSYHVRRLVSLSSFYFRHQW